MQGSSYSLIIIIVHRMAVSRRILRSLHDNVAISLINANNERSMNAYVKCIFEDFPSESDRRKISFIEAAHYLRAVRRVERNFLS